MNRTLTVHHDLKKTITIAAALRSVGMIAMRRVSPLVYATHTGTKAQRPLATVVIGEIRSSMALTLLVPILYRYAYRRGRECHSHWHKAADSLVIHLPVASGMARWSWMPEHNELLVYGR